MKLLIDTNIFLELLLKQKKEPEVKELFSKIDEHEFFITDYSLHSIGMLFFYRKQHQTFLDFLNDMLIIEGGFSMVRLNPEEIKEVIYASQKFNLDFDDAYQYVTAEKYNLTIISFDTDFDRTKLKKKTPTEILK